MKVFLDQDKAYKLWRKGLSDGEIAVRLGVKRDTVSVWRRKHHLKCNRVRARVPVQERCKLSQDAYEAKLADMNYGMWKAQQWEAAGRPKYRRGA